MVCYTPELMYPVGRGWYANYVDTCSAVITGVYT